MATLKIIETLTTLRNAQVWIASPKQYLINTAEALLEIFEITRLSSTMQNGEVDGPKFVEAYECYELLHRL